MQGTAGLSWERSVVSLETQGTQVWNRQNPFEIKRLAIACSYVPKKNHIEDKR